MTKEAHRSSNWIQRDTLQDTKLLPQDKNKRKLQTLCVYIAQSFEKQLIKSVGEEVEDGRSGQDSVGSSGRHRGQLTSYLHRGTS